MEFIKTVSLWEFSNVYKRINVTNGSVTALTLTSNVSYMRPNLIHLNFPSLFSGTFEL